MNKIKNIIVLFLFFSLIKSPKLYSQVIEGKTFVYKHGVYDMSSPDGFKRVEINKGFSKLPITSYINFKNTSIILNVGRTETSKEIYLHLTPKYGDKFNKFTTFGNPWDLININAIGASDNTVDIRYYKSKIWEDRKGILLFSDYKNNTMYIFKCDDDIDELVSKLNYN